jgi:hypothetical protein
MLWAFLGSFNRNKHSHGSHPACKHQPCRSPYTRMYLCNILHDRCIRGPNNTPNAGLGVKI